MVADSKSLVVVNNNAVFESKRVFTESEIMKPKDNVDMVLWSLEGKTKKLKVQTSQGKAVRTWSSIPPFKCSKAVLSDPKLSLLFAATVILSTPDADNRRESKNVLSRVILETGDEVPLVEITKSTGLDWRVNGY